MCNNPLLFATDNAPEGSHNFRDLGSIRTKDGLSVKKGKIFRSGDLSNLSERGRLRMKELGIEIVFDLRDKAERARRPYEWCKQDGIAYWAQDYDMSGASIRDLLKIANVAGPRFQEEMISVYREMPFLLAPAYSALLTAIAENPGPIVFGCTAGKDRTGFGAALLLSLLGAAWETIVADYRATNRFIEDLKRMVANDHQTDSSAERLLPVLTADVVYLDASFEAIARRCGSLENYCVDILSVSDRQLACIRENLFETRPD